MLKALKSKLLADARVVNEPALPAPMEETNTAASDPADI